MTRPCKYTKHPAYVSGKLQPRPGGCSKAKKDLHPAYRSGKLPRKGCGR